MSEDAKQPATHFVGVRMPVPLYQAAKSAATKDERSVAHVIKTALRKDLGRRGLLKDDAQQPA